MPSARPVDQASSIAGLTSPVADARAAKPPSNESSLSSYFFSLCVAMLSLAITMSFFMPNRGMAATVYIDPTCSNNGDGTRGEPCATSRGASGPRNTWMGLKWTPGNTYAGQGGTMSNLTRYIVEGSGTAGDPITITSYGTGRHVLNGNDSYAIAFINRSYITFDNVEVRSNVQHGIYFSNNASSRNLIIQNCYFVHVVGNAVQFGESGRNTDFDNVTIVNNKFESIGGAGIAGTPFDIGSAQNWNNFTIANNTFTNIGTSSTNSAIDFLMSGGTSATMTNLTITGNVISHTNVGETSVAAPSIRLARSPIGSAAENRFSNVNISDNTITTTDMGMIYLAHARPPSRIANNTIHDLASNAAVAVFYSNGVEVSGNTIRNIAPLAVSDYIDGAGLDLEVNSNLSVHGNTITGNLGHASHVNSGQGVYAYNDRGSLVFSNLLVGNKLGIMSDAGVSMTTFANNTIVNSTKYGIWASPFAAYAHWFVNNVITGSGEYGIFTTGKTAQMLTSNLFFGNRSGDYGSQIGGMSDLTVDPLYMGSGNFELNAASPAARAGTWWGSSCIDLRGRPCIQGRMALGAYQPAQDGTSPSAPAGVKAQ
jgi:hypothetical protein